MNNMLKRLLVAALAISAAHVSAHTNKNFLSSPRAQAASMLGDSHLTRNLAQAKGNDRFGGNFLVSGFYSESRNSKALGKYFGVKDQDSFKANIGNNLAANDLQLGYLVHDHTLAGGGAAHGATVTLAPKTISYGAEFAYKQCLGKVLEGLHLSIALPVERVENNMNLTTANNFPASAGDADLVKNLLAGKFSNAVLATAAPGWTGAQNQQSALKNALIDGKQTATGIADINVVLGYDFVRGGDWRAGLNLGLVIPTGNSATGKYVFEPIYGNGNHWELGFGGAVDGFLWRDGDQSIELHVSADYRYGFKANEVRTLGLNNKEWGQYYLTGVVGGLGGATTVASANVLTQSVGVTPGSAFRGNLGLEYDNGGFLFGLNYAPAWRQAESITGGKMPANTGVMLLAREFGVGGINGAALVAATDFDGAAAGIMADSAISTDQAKRESQLAHRLGGNMGYTFKEMDYPITIGFGGHYEFAGDNAVAENWGVNLTAGIGF